DDVLRQHRRRGGVDDLHVAGDARVVADQQVVVGGRHLHGKGTVSKGKVSDLVYAGVMLIEIETNRRDIREVDMTQKRAERDAHGVQDLVRVRTLRRIEEVVGKGADNNAKGHPAAVGKLHGKILGHVDGVARVRKAKADAELQIVVAALVPRSGRQIVF